MSDPPASKHDEEAVIGACLVSGQAIRLVTVDAGLRPEHFYFEQHRAIYGAIHRISARAEPVDVLTVAAELGKQQEVKVSHDQLHAFGSSSPAPGNASHYARLVVDAADLRAKRAGAQTVLAGVEHRDTDEIQRGIEQLQSDLVHQAEPVEPLELADEFYEWLDATGPVETMKLPWPRLNHLTSGGLRRGHVTALISWTNFGKSILLDQILAGFHEQGFKSILFITEMDRHERMTRWISARTGIEYARIMLKANLSQEERARILKVLNEGIPFAIRESSGLTAEQICQEIIVRNVDVAAIDPLHQLPYNDAADLRRMMRMIVRTARRAKVHLLLVGHLNTARLRDVKAPPPVTRDIRDSGSIATDANNILALHREQDADGNPLEDGRLYWLKVRGGIRGGCNVRFDAERFRFNPETVGRPAKQEQNSLDEPPDDDLIF